MSDYLLMAAIAGTVGILTWAMSTVYYTSRVYEVKRECAERIEQINKDYAMQRRLYKENSDAAAVGEEEQ